MNSKHTIDDDSSFDSIVCACVRALSKLNKNHLMFKLNGQKLSQHFSIPFRFRLFHPLEFWEIVLYIVLKIRLALMIPINHITKCMRKKKNEAHTPAPSQKDIYIHFHSLGHKLMMSRDFFFGYSKPKFLAWGWNFVKLDLYRFMSVITI